MSSSKRQRELARRRAERQAQRRAIQHHRKRRRDKLIYGSVFGLVLLLVLGLTLGKKIFGKDSAEPTAQPTPTASETPVACGATAPPAPKQQTFPKEPPLTVDKKKTYTATMQTSCGAIRFELFADKAPHTVNSFAFLADKQFYDGTFCHRMTGGGPLTVLQCGDPEGTGSGGPGYTLAEENLKGAKYTRGIVAMAKTSQPHTTGSQFFLIAKDSELPPQYTVVGRMDAASLAILDKIVKLGINPVNAPGDGAPRQKVYIESFRVTAK